MSNAKGENPEFDELDLPEQDANLSERDLLPPNALEDTLEFEAPAEVQHPVEGTLEPAEEGLESGQPGLGVAAQGEADSVAGEPPEEEPEKEEEEEKGPSFLEKLTTTSPYVVLLGISLLAIVIGILCLFMEWWVRYGGQTRPPQASVAPAVQSGPASTTAAT